MCYCYIFLLVFFLCLINKYFWFIFVHAFLTHYRIPNLDLICCSVFFPVMYLLAIQLLCLEKKEQNLEDHTKDFLDLVCLKPRTHLTTARPIMNVI